jgi:hypothetical protein
MEPYILVRHVYYPHILTKRENARYDVRPNAPEDLHSMKVGCQIGKAKGQQARFYYNYLKCVWIISFFDWVWPQPFLGPAN